MNSMLKSMFFLVVLMCNFIHGYYEHKVFNNTLGFVMVYTCN
jgi:hypothetical protein